MSRITMHARAWLLALLCCAGAQADDLTVGNVAPGTGAVQIYINGKSAGPALDYLAFTTIADVSGDIQVEARSVSDDRSIARATLTVNHETLVRPMLVLAGNGTLQPFEIYYFEGDGRFGPTAAHLDAAFGAHHLAPYETEDSPRWSASLQCEVPGSSFTGAWGGDSQGRGYGSFSTHTYALRNDTGTCTMQIANAQFGNFTVPAALHAGSTVRMILTGDGVAAPFQVIVIEDGALLTTATPATPAPGAVTFSADIWYDVARPAQAVTLYEQSGASAMSGFWVTHDNAGKPVWFFLDGVRTALPGQRDIALHRFSAKQGAAPLSDAGTARLFYIDCNQAELRILSGEREFHTLRLRRSREVPACEVFD